MLRFWRRYLKCSKYLWSSSGFCMATWRIEIFSCPAACSTLHTLPNHAKSKNDMSFSIHPVAATWSGSVKQFLGPNSFSHGVLRIHSPVFSGSSNQIWSNMINILGQPPCQVILNFRMAMSSPGPVPSWLWSSAQQNKPGGAGRCSRAWWRSWRWRLRKLWKLAEILAGHPPVIN